MFSIVSSGQLLCHYFTTDILKSYCIRIEMRWGKKATIKKQQQINRNEQK